jgi:TolB-like protein/DNA-binding winged helix-turn-helix (wHTH) protein/Tfp pilus assembly protein PilF
VVPPHPGDPLPASLSNDVTGPVFEFGDFRLDCGRFELVRGGNSLRVERKPMELLILLVSRQGQLVTRAEIAQRLWSSEVFVDTEHGINTAIRKLRYLLRDDSEEPKFIQTVTGMGYRFVARTFSVGEPATDSPKAPPAEPAVLDPGLAAETLWPPSTQEAPKKSLAVQIFVVARFVALTVAFIVMAIGPRQIAGLLHRDPNPPITSLAVIPLDNLSGDPNQEYFADGITDELITMLAKDSTLRITSRTSVMQYKGARKPLPDIARALNVDAILEGSVSRSNNQVHMTLQLIRADTDAHLWAESYDRSTNDVAALPDEAARSIADRLRSPATSAKPARYVSPEAHDAYLRGRYYWFGDNYEQCKAYMEKAIQLQPDYAMAWSGLSEAYDASAIGEMPPKEAFEKAHDAANRALQLDDSLDEAHDALAAYYFFDAWDWRRAEAESQRAVALNSNNAEIHHLRSYILRSQNRDQEALEEQKRATQIDPFGRPWALGSAYIYLHQYDAAIDELQARASSRQQDFWVQEELAKAYWFKGKKNAWAMHLEQGYLVISDKKSADAIQHNFEKGGATAVAQWALDADLKKARTAYVSPMNLAFDYAQLGRKEDTLRSLEDAVQERSPWLVFIQKEPAFDFLHADPRFRSFVQRIGLPPAY